LAIVPFSVLVLTSAARAADDHDFALFDGSNPANQPNSGAVCSSEKDPFTYHVVVANWGADGEVRITYKDGDFIRFPIKAGESFSFTQAAGSDKNGPDSAVRVSNGGSAAQLAGSMSASGEKRVSCISCDADSAGDAGCDAIVPN
jgi:hypothetical protein